MIVISFTFCISAYDVQIQIDILLTDMNLEYFKQVLTFSDILIHGLAD